jgi:hypothetical protein
MYFLSRPGSLVMPVASLRAGSVAQEYCEKTTVELMIAFKEFFVQYANRPPPLNICRADRVPFRTSAGTPLLAHLTTTGNDSDAPVPGPSRSYRPTGPIRAVNRKFWRTL